MIKGENTALYGLNKTIFEKIIMICNQDREVHCKCKLFHARSKIEEVGCKCKKDVKLISLNEIFEK